MGIFMGNEILLHPKPKLKFYEKHNFKYYNDSLRVCWNGVL